MRSTARHSTCWAGLVSFVLGAGLRGLKTPPTPPFVPIPLCSISIAATAFHRDQGRANRRSQCQLLVSAGANPRRVRAGYGMEKVLSEPGLAAHCSLPCEGTGGGESYFLASSSVLSPFYSTQ